MFKENKGITLVALVVTIIVLLILAAVSISAVMGDNGIVTKSQKAQEKTEEEKLKEALELKLADLEIESFTEDSTTVTNKIMGEMLKGIYRYEESLTVVKINGIFENDGSLFKADLTLSKEDTNSPVSISMDNITVVEKVDKMAEPLIHMMSNNTSAFTSVVDNGDGSMTVTYDSVDYTIYREMTADANIIYIEATSTNV